MYLAAIKDMATREIVGWSMADHLRAELACDALADGRSSAGSRPAG